MRRAFKTAVALLFVAAVAAGGAWLWRLRPWRVVASVNGTALTARELDMRVKTLGGDRLSWTKAWIVKELLLGEAVQRNVPTAQGDEQETMALVTSWLATRKMTPEQFFAEGPLPEASKRQDFKEGVLINNFVRGEMSTRGFGDVVRELHGKSVVKCPEFPELERPLDGAVPLYAGIWGWWPMRVAASVDGNLLTSAELDLRSLTMLDDIRRMGRNVPKEREHETLRHYRREAAKQWFLKQVLRAEAVRRGFSVTQADEKEELAKVVAPLRKHNLTVTQFFEEGPLPESVKWADFRASILVKKFTMREVGDKISVSTKEIDEKMAELRKKAAEEAAAGGKPTVKTDRKSAIDQLRSERFARGYRDLFRSLFVKARVSCPEFPDLESVDGVSPPRPEDGEGK